MQRRRFLELSLAAGASLALAGCGFRLRGLDGRSLDIDELTLASTDGELARLVAERLETAGTRVHASAPLVLNLGREAFRERPLSVLDRGPRELELELRVPFSVQRQSDGAYRLHEQTLEVSTRFTISDEELLNQEDIRKEMQDDLRREAVRQLLNRLRSLSDA